MSPNTGRCPQHTELEEGPELGCAGNGRRYGCWSGMNGAGEAVEGEGRGGWVGEGGDGGGSGLF